jgi:hypothetical protein
MAKVFAGIQSLLGPDAVLSGSDSGSRSDSMEHPRRGGKPLGEMADEDVGG